MMSAFPKLEMSPLTPLPTGVDAHGKLRPPVKCLLLDIYGTLFISGSGDVGTSRQQASANHKLERLLLRFGIKQPAPDLLEALYAAIEGQHRLARAKGIDYPEVEIDQIWSQVLNWPSAQAARPFAIEFEMIMNPVWPMPGLDLLLNQCRANAILMGIISNAQFFTLPLFEHFLGRHVADLGFHRQLCILSFKHGRAKPSAALFQMAVSRLKQLGIAAQETVFMGNDMLNDIKPSRDAGLQTVLFAGDARSLRMRTQDHRCAGIRPDMVVTTLDQVIPFLDPGSGVQ